MQPPYSAVGAQLVDHVLANALATNGSQSSEMSHLREVGQDHVCVGWSHPLCPCVAGMPTAWAARSK